MCSSFDELEAKSVTVIEPKYKLFLIVLSLLFSIQVINFKNRFGLVFVTGPASSQETQSFSQLKNINVDDELQVVMKRMMYMANCSSRVCFVLKHFLMEEHRCRLRVAGVDDELQVVMMEVMR
ncbi:hypothetical protein L1987_33733 [Smallanthus sonchifolius]|uniref:Uncharacterized protein n=1 Tax=Smallanthus sonchifolius TaxID=185202 RepID=A0ACB9HSJ2_9ASTR|nr:hypothetical protein L1987_33733 [Smallanthus sonchifolius]